MRRDFVELSQLIPLFVVERKSIIWNRQPSDRLCVNFQLNIESQVAVFSHLKKLPWPNSQHLDKSSEVWRRRQPTVVFLRLVLFCARIVHLMTFDAIFGSYTENIASHVFGTLHRPAGRSFAHLSYSLDSEVSKTTPRQKHGERRKCGVCRSVKYQHYFQPYFCPTGRSWNLRVKQVGKVG